MRQYFESIPEEKVPKINTPGESYREQQLSYQWPKQDLALIYCNHIESQNKASYEDFVAGRNEIAIDIAYVKDLNSGSEMCVNCDDDIKQDELAVIAPKFRDKVSMTSNIAMCQILISQVCINLGKASAEAYKWGIF